MERRGGVRVLIDTHYLLWAAVSSKRMEAWAKELIGDLNNDILVSAASVYEISLKVRKGRLLDAVEFESDLITNIERRLGYTLLPLEPESMMRAARSRRPMLILLIASLQRRRFKTTCPF